MKRFPITTHAHLFLSTAFALLVGVACNISDSSDQDNFGSPNEGDACAQEGSTRLDFVCRDGAWSLTDPTSPADMGTPPPTDMATTNACSPESDAVLCAAANANCGFLPPTVDSCGLRRAPDCGECPGGDVCIDNTCGCPGESDQELCQMTQAVCGALSVMDSCGVERMLDCGTCMGEDEVCENNACFIPCGDETSADLCRGAGAQCGAISVVNACGVQVTINCGQCQGAGEQCTSNNTCGCVPDTDQELCAAANAQCGQVSLTDNCGVTRTINCGGCAGADDVCDMNNQCICTPETDEAFCGRNNAQCGMFSGMDNCGSMRVANCGTCNEGTCESDNTCSVCQPEGATQFCARLGITCGDVTELDNCGDIRTAACGSCTNERVCNGSNACECPAPSCNNVECGLTFNACNNSSDCGGCGNNEVCQANQCVCQPETDAELCAGAGATCGSVTVQDRCNTTRTVNCGACSGSQVCVNGGNTCCSSESNADFCQGAGAECGNISGTDNCGYPRSISCGGCGNNEICNGSNQCECVAETDQQLCQMAGAICGSLTVQDRCNATRTVSCGTCPTSGGRDNNTCSSNACSCTPYTNAQVCSNAGATCGSVTGSDGCGGTKTATCGSCPTSNGRDNNTCNGNQCVCTPYTNAQICSAEGASCGGVTGSDGCGNSKSVFCGGCSGGCCNEFTNQCSSGLCP